MISRNRKVAKGGISSIKLPFYGSAKAEKTKNTFGRV
jgi:hypothetical protein